MTYGAGRPKGTTGIVLRATAGDDPDRRALGGRSIKSQRYSGSQAGAWKQDNPAWLPIIYEYEGDDIYCEDNWFQANPLGITIDVEKVRQEALDAKQSEAVERYSGGCGSNQWISTRDGWMAAADAVGQNRGAHFSRSAVRQKVFLGDGPFRALQILRRWCSYFRPKKGWISGTPVSPGFQRSECGKGSARTTCLFQMGEGGVIRALRAMRWTMRRWRIRCCRS